jgi:serine/threonine protein kinase
MGSPVAPERFGNYVVHERLGAGGMATVHRATSASGQFAHPVALKRLLPHLAHDESFVRAFVREARIAAQLRHPNVAQTFDLGLVDESYYIAMELIEGNDLRKVLRQSAGAAGPMPPALVVNLLAQVCEALDYAHGMTDEHGQPLGIVHRDVSPANIIISHAGIAKLIDFGIARASSSSLMTMSGQLKGKFAYIAPETIQGTFDARADLFSLGVVAHELLTAQQLLTGTDEIDTLRRVREHPIQPPSAVTPGIPEEVDSIVMTALSRDPGERWQSAAAMRGALGVIASRANLQATPADLARWIQWAFEVRPSKRRPAVAARDTGRRRAAHDTDVNDDSDHDSAEVSMVVDRPDHLTDEQSIEIAVVHDPGRGEDPRAESLGAAPASSETLEFLVGAATAASRPVGPGRAERSTASMRATGGRRTPSRPADAATVEMRPATVEHAGTEHASTVEMHPAEVHAAAAVVTTRPIDEFDVRSTGRRDAYADPSELGTTGRHPAFDAGFEPNTLVDVDVDDVVAEVAAAPSAQPTLEMISAPLMVPDYRRPQRTTGPSGTARSSAVPMPSPTVPPALGSIAPPGRPLAAASAQTMVATGTPHGVVSPPQPTANGPYVQLGAEYNAAAASYAQNIMTPQPGSMTGREIEAFRRGGSTRHASTPPEPEVAPPAPSPASAPKKSVVPLLLLCVVLAGGVAAAGYF